QTILLGGKARFAITVTNTGTAMLRGVVVTDSHTPACSRTRSTTAAFASLAPGASARYTCARENVRASFTNVATAVATGAQGVRVRATDSARVRVRAPLRPAPRPAIQIVKGPTSQTITRRGVARFNLTIQNTGNVLLRRVQVRDPRAPDCNRS